MAIAGPKIPARVLGHVYDSSIAAWIPDPRTAVAAPGSTTVTMSTGTVTSVPVAGSTAALANVAAGSTSVTALSSNANRVTAIFFNDATNNCYLKFGATASTSSWSYRLQPTQGMELPCRYTGRIDAIWDSTVTGNLRVTEVSI